MGRFARGSRRRQVTRSSTVDVTTANDLPEDVLCEILLRLPAKQLCRSRAVCRAWNSILSGRLFANARAARHPDPLLVAVSADDPRFIDVKDLSGSVVKRIDVTTPEKTAAPGAGNAAFLVRTTAGICVVDTASGAVSAALPDSTYSSYALGWVASDRKHKVLRVYRSGSSPSEQVCQVLTLGPGGRAWARRRRQPPPFLVSASSIHTVVVDGVVHFLPERTNRPSWDEVCMASFDLGTEEWALSVIRGPLSRRVTVEGNGRKRYDYVMPGRPDVRLAEVNGCLALVVRGVLNKELKQDYGTMDLWFWRKRSASSSSSSDMVMGWVREHKVRPSQSRYDGNDPRPMFVLSDGRILLLASIWTEATAIGAYDPRTQTCKDVVRIGEFCFIGLVDRTQIMMSPL